ncbi:MAG: hypothetical protein JW913_08615 [Chitinispirillaceae bacterium]|nr:hypothetical protein [Chitinispirillaceae bacterium]
MAPDDKNNARSFLPVQKIVPPLDHPPHIEPLFWGTGDLLVWEAEKLLQAIDRESLFRTVWAGKNMNDEEYARVRNEILAPRYEEMCGLIIMKNLLDPRGFYGFFPVITDSEAVILLDPVDFHTELLELTFSQPGAFEGHLFSDFFRPDGDVIGISAVTAGKRMEKVIEEQMMGYDSGNKGYLLQGIASTITVLLVAKTAIEMRRSLGIPDSTGRAFSLITETSCNPGLKELIEITAIEERLGIFLENGTVVSPEFSSIDCFVHHPALNTFMQPPENREK